MLYSTRVNFRCNKTTRNRFILFHFLLALSSYTLDYVATCRHCAITNQAARLWLSRLSQLSRRRRPAFCLSVSLRYHSDTKHSAVVPRRHDIDTGNGQSVAHARRGCSVYAMYSSAASIIYKHNITTLTITKAGKTNTVKRTNVHAGFKFSIVVAFYHR